MTENKLWPDACRLAFLLVLVESLFILSADDVYALDKGLEFHLSSEVYSEPISIYALINDFDGDLGSGDLAFTQNRAWLSVKLNRFAIGAYSFYDYFLWFNEDTALLNYLDKNNLSVPEGASFDLYLRASHVSGKGMRFQYDFVDRPLFKLSIAANFFKTQKIIEGSIEGFASGKTDQESYLADLNINYFYDQDKLFDRPIDKRPQGKGLSFDAYLSVHYENWLLEFAGLDLFRRIKWDDLPQTVAKIETTSSEFDERGFFVFNPVLRGKETERDYSQRGGDRYQLKVFYHLNQLELGTLIDQYRQMTFYSLSVNKMLSENLKMGMAYRINTQSLQLQLRHRYVGISIGADNADIEKEAKAFSLAFQFSIPF